MKRTIAMLSALILAACAASCNEKTGKADHSDVSTAAASTTEAATEAETESDATEAAASTKKAAETQTQSVTTAAASVTTAAQSGSSDANFTYDANGAVQFKEDSAEADDQTLMAAAQALYESACKTQWYFTVGSPYELDMNDYIENQYNWQFYRIKDANITSMADIRADYHKVFSDRYPDELDLLYMEKDGHVYALAGSRGANIFYGYSKITDIRSKGEDEIFFTVTNYYDETDFGGENSYSEEEEFSVVIDSEGVWRAGKFRLPY